MISINYPIEWVFKKFYRYSMSVNEKISESDPEKRKADWSQEQMAENSQLNMSLNGYAKMSVVKVKST